jgi:hypothetical protein
VLIGFAAFAALAVAAEGSGGATVVWMQDAVPSDDARARAERLIGTTAAHAAWADIAFPATPVTKDDDARFAALERAKADARARWDQFDVELGLAAGLAAAVGPIDILRTPADARALAEALLLEGAAAARVVPDARFATADELAPYRMFLGSSAVLHPMVDALAILPDAVWARSDLPDSAAFARLSGLRDDVAASPAGKLELAPMPAVASVVLDGVPLALGAHDAPIAPGRHYLHVSVGGRVVGRRTFDATPDTVTFVEPTVNHEELAAANSRILEGSKELPDDVAKAVAVLGDHGGHATPTFVAAVDAKGQVRVLPYGAGAAIHKRPAVTVILSGTVGGGVILSPAFADAGGDPTLGAAIGGDLGAELGIYNLAVMAGTTLQLTPTESMRYANADSTANEETNAYFRPYGGLGVYLPRPDRAKPLILLGVNYGWMSPGALGVGGRVSFGVPITGDGTWLRIDLDAFRGTQMTEFPAEGEPTVFGALRLGFGRMI